MGIEAPITFTGNFDKLTKDFNGQSKLIGDAVKGLFAYFTVGKVVEGLHAIIDQASETEKSVTRLANSLRGSGDATDNNIKRFQEFAEVMQRSSEFTKDQILAQISLAKTFGTSNKEAEQLVKTAVDLSAATGIDLNSAVNELGLSLSGNARQMAKQFPVIRQLTEEQLRHGGAIKALGALYEGSAARGLQNYSGKTAQLSHSFEDFEKILGNVIIKNPKFLKDIDDISAALISLTAVLARNQDRLISWSSGFASVYGTLLLALTTRNVHPFVDALKAMNKEVDHSSEIVDLFGGKFKSLVQIFNPITGKFDALSSGAKKSGEDVHELGDQFDFVRGKMIKGFDEGTTRSLEDFKKLKQEFQSLKDSLRDVGETESQTLTNTFNRHRKLIDDALSHGYESQKERQVLLGELELKYTREVYNLRKKEFDELAQKLKEIYDNPIKGFFPNINQNKNGKLNISEATQKQISTYAGLAGTVLQGAQGAGALLADAGTAAAEAFFGPAGQAAGPIITALEQGPVAMKQMVDQFADALPALLKNILEAVPAVIQEMADKAPDIIAALVEDAPEIIETLVEATPQISLKLAEILPRTLAKVFGDGATRFIGQILSGAVQFVGKIIQGAGEFVQKLINSLSSGGGIFSSGGGGGLSGLTAAVSPLAAALGLKAGSVAGLQSQPRSLSVNVHISNKQLATAIIDLRKSGFAI